MEREFNKIYEQYVRLIEDGGEPPPMDPSGGGGAAAPEEPQSPCFSNTDGISYLVPFIRIYNSVKESGSLPDRVTRVMMAYRETMNDTTSARLKKQLKKIFRAAGISEVDVQRAQEENKKSYAKVKEVKGDDVKVRPVGVSELRRMLDVIGQIADRVKDGNMRDLQRTSAPVSELEFPNKEEIDYSNIWVAYNRIVGDVCGEFRSGV